MTEKEFLEEFGPNGRGLWIVPMSRNIDILMNSGLCKPLGVFKTHITSVKKDIILLSSWDLEIDKSDFIHLLNMPEDTPKECKGNKWQFDYMSCEEINKLVKHQEYIELNIEDYRERYGEGYIDQILS